MQTIELEIDGMHCGGCVARVSDALKKIPGVTTDKVDVGSAKIQADPAAQPAILAALDKLGFDARIKKAG
jgi:copper chaperone CopZ